MKVLKLKNESIKLSFREKLHEEAKDIDEPVHSKANVGWSHLKRA